MRNPDHIECIVPKKNPSKHMASQGKFVVRGPQPGPLFIMSDNAIRGALTSKLTNIPITSVSAI